jgi:hypothetical protein
VVNNLTVTPFLPLEEQTAGVVVVKLTLSPDDAAALTVIRDCLRL